MTNTVPLPHDLQALIAGLCAGPQAALNSPEDWARQLGTDTSEAAQSFVAQLRQEWLPAVPPDDPEQLYAQVAERTRKHIEWHSSWPHVWAHTLRVTGAALALAPEARVEREYAYLLGVLHDVGKLDEITRGVAHELVGGLMARKFLRELGVSHFFTEQIANAIAKRGNRADPFVRLLHDADKLDKIGATGIARRLSTEFGGKNPALALRQVIADAERFPDMNFPLSRRLADLKLTYTRLFVEMVRPVLNSL